MNKAATPIEIDGEQYWGCPRRPLYDAPDMWGELIDLVSLFRKGFLPDPGGVAQQAHKGLQMIMRVDRHLDECDNELREARRTRGARS